MSQPTRPRTNQGTHTEAFTQRDWLMLSAVALTWGSSFFLISVGIDAFHPTVVSFGRIGFGALALLLVPAARAPIDRGDWPRIVLLGAVWMAIPLTLFPIAEQWVSSSLAGMLNGAMPIMTAVIAVLLGAGRPGRNQIVGLAIGFGGAVLIALPSLAEGGSAATGVAAILGAVICYGISANLAVPLQQRYGGPTLMLRVELVGAAMVAPFAFVGLGSSTFEWRSFVAVLVLGFVGTGLAFAVMSAVLGRVGATRGSLVTYLMPPVSIGLGVLFLDETVEPISLVGIVVVLAGAYLVSRRDDAAARRIASDSDDPPLIPGPSGAPPERPHGATSTTAD